MTSFSRRSVFKLTAASATALAAPGIMVRAANAQMDMSAMAGGEYKAFKLGEFDVAILSDGHRVVPNPQSIFGTDQTKEAVEELLAENFLPKDKMQFTFAPVVVKAGSDVVLFDTGNGESARDAGAGRTLMSLQAAGYKPEDVTVVVLTHLHGDHIGGIMEGGKPAFPNARYVTGKTEYAWWTDGARKGTPAEGNATMVQNMIVPFADKMTMIDDGGSVVSGITGMNAFGHTPGHMIYMLESGGKQLVLTADSANHYVASLQRPDWQVVFDVDKAQATETRKKVFDMIATDRIPFIGYHMPFPAAGYIEKVDMGYRFVPETYQFDI